MLSEEYAHKWHRCEDIIRDNIGEHKFETWFSHTRAIDYDENEDVLTLAVRSSFVAEKYEDEFYNILSLALKREFGKKVRIIYETYIIDGDDDSCVKVLSKGPSTTINNKVIKQKQKPVDPSSSNNNKGDIDPQLNPTLCFENYCVSESNRLAFTIAEHISENPINGHFNPFFLYGDVGVGKTHLVQAIGIRVKERFPEKKVLFTSARLFQNLYQKAQRDGVVPQFINYFTDIDVLILDDLQELERKVKTTNDALFPIFNHLHLNGKQLIFTCDKPPMELDGIATRLIDRFKWGMTEKLPKPDLELRKKILSFKAKKNGVQLPEDVIEVVAQNTSNSIREIEGIVIGILTRAIVKNAPITKEMALEVMKNSIKHVEKKTINFDMIVESTAEYFNLNPDVIFSKSRVRDIADARQVIMYLAHNLTGLSSKSIGSRLNREHTTVLHGITSITERRPYVKELSDALDAIEQNLQK